MPAPPTIVDSFDLIATIALGLVVDDTCHFLVRLRTHISRGMSLPEAIAETMKQTGRPIILTSIILSTGFMILVLGSFTPTLCFGLVSAFVLLVALVADLVVLPPALLLLRRLLSVLSVQEWRWRRMPWPW